MEVYNLFMTVTSLFTNVAGNISLLKSLMPKSRPLGTSAKSNLKEFWVKQKRKAFRVLGEAEEKSFLPLTGRAGTLWALVSQKDVT